MLPRDPSVSVLDPQLLLFLHLLSDCAQQREPNDMADRMARLCVHLLPQPDARVPQQGTLVVPACFGPCHHARRLQREGKFCASAHVLTSSLWFSLSPISSIRTRIPFKTSIFWAVFVSETDSGLTSQLPSDISDCLQRQTTGRAMPSKSAGRQIGRLHSWAAWHHWPASSSVSSDSGTPGCLSIFSTQPNILSASSPRASTSGTGHAALCTTNTHSSPG